MEELKQNLSLSPITLGTMRFADKKLSVIDVLRLIEEGYSIGIDTHHSSYEYSSYDLYSSAISKASCKKSIKHIVKISSPHFEETKFSHLNLETKIDNELRKLDIDSIDVLQWLVRSKPINDKDRLHTLISQKDEILNSLYKLKKKGKIKSVFSFPYSPVFAQEVIKLPHLDGVISYLNKEEKEYENFAKTVPFIAIRPFFAGKLIKSSKTQDVIKGCLSHVLKYQNVLSTVVGINSVNQLEVYKEFLK
ncbi:hypothetical protein D6T69_05720 [Tenacibaculum singaporense]|uniref:NADP-dependent oxidoreductase domain-containing protein n=1 Tax=Tenacibaculum singaporense TaxID=2358479 RepID=A0A3S8R5K1_9FLAO|nr:aldo/keto reductase [Tenacibaculum singaporense]AZJ35046.1 hypothetical protein D6T69_05720 [Tenacibaculum singaporense]